MRRGFKTLAEKHALDARSALKIASTAPLDPWKYADHLGVMVLPFGELGLAKEAIRQLTVIDDESWSALTISENGTFAIVLNPAHAKTRLMNDLTHELCHIELKHQPATVEVSPTGLMLLSDFSDEQEQEADWRAAALLLPRPGLMNCRSKQMAVAEIAAHYGVSTQLCEWRLRMTGVDVQLRRSFAR